MSRKPPNPLTVKELGTIKALRASGLTYHAIAVEISRDPKTIKKACLEPEAQEQIQVIKEELSGMFEGLAKRMITSISDDDILKISAYQRTISAGISTDKMRLLKGESTANFSINSLLQSIHSSIFAPDTKETKTIDITPRKKSDE